MSHPQHWGMENFFSPVFLKWWGKVSGSEKLEKFWPYMGFRPKLFFQNSCFFSNKSHRKCYRGPFIGRKECTLPYMVILPLTEATLPSNIPSMWLITKDWWILKKKFGWKPHMGSKFSKFFTSKTFPPPSRKYGRKKIWISPCKFTYCEYITLLIVST